MKDLGWRAASKMTSALPKLTTSSSGEWMTDEDARRGQGRTELGGGAGQVIDAQAERRVGRLGIGVRSASKVQAEHGHTELVEAAGDQHHGPWLPVRQVQPPGQPVPACTGKRERSGLGHGDTFLRTAAGWP